MAGIREKRRFERDRSSTGPRSFARLGTQASTEVNLTGNIFFTDTEFDVLDPSVNPDIGGDPAVNLIATVKWDSGVNIIADEADMELRFIFDGRVVDQAQFTLEADEERFAPGLGTADLPEKYWGETVEMAAQLVRRDQGQTIVDEASVSRRMGTPEGYDPSEGGNGGNNGGDGGDGGNDGGSDGGGFFQNLSTTEQAILLGGGLAIGLAAVTSGSGRSRPSGPPLRR